MKIRIIPLLVLLIAYTPFLSFAGEVNYESLYEAYLSGVRKGIEDGLDIVPLGKSKNLTLLKEYSGLTKDCYESGYNRGNNKGSFLKFLKSSKNCPISYFEKRICIIQEMGKIEEELNLFKEKTGGENLSAAQILTEMVSAERSGKPIERLKGEKQKQEADDSSPTLSRSRPAWCPPPTVATTAEKQIAERQKSTGKIVDLRGGVTLELVWIPPGEFMMGSKDTPRAIASKSGGKGSWDTDEYPRHKVSITNGFWMGKYEVTQAQWQALMGSNPSHFKDAGANAPVEKISWDDCQKFLKKVSQRTGQTFRLPTEAEWEYACRAGAETAFHYGDTLTSSQANFNGDHPYGGAAKGVDLGRTTPVGSYRPNAFGLYDMHGNVFEWCQDWYGENYYQNSPVSNPPGPSFGLGRINRGGSWREYAGNCRSAYRNGLKQDGRYFIFGLRVVMVSEEQSGKSNLYLPPTKSPEAPENNNKKETLEDASRNWNWRYKLALHLKLFLFEYSIISSVIVNKADDDTIEIQLKDTRGPSKSGKYIHSLVRNEAKSWLGQNGISFGYVSVQVD